MSATGRPGRELLSGWGWRSGDGRTRGERS
jgi:hypothetical protein